MKITPKPIRVFSREEPCTKVHLYNCFMSTGSPVPRAVVEARGEIGVNSIKYLKRNGYAVEVEREGVDCWELTRDGVEWLEKGLARHLELHPADRTLVQYRGGTSKPTRRTRVRRA